MDYKSDYLSFKPYLLAVSYNMLGQVQEAEDVVQDAFEDFLINKAEKINNIKSYLTRIVINKCIDRLAELKKQRELYPALWLPEPYIISESDGLQNADILPYVFVHLMENLNPIERAVVILREGFDYTYDEISELCNLTSENCRQILHRAKVKLNQDSFRSTVREAKADGRVLQVFLDACLTNNTKELAALLKEDVMLYSDGGGKVVAARKVLEGFTGVVKFLTGIIRKTLNKWSAAKPVMVNGEPALLMPDENGIYMIFIPYIKDAKIASIYLMRNPDKIFIRNSVTK